MKTKQLLNLAAIAFAVTALFAFTAPKPTKFKADTKASTIAWTAKKVTGQHNGTVPVSAGELVADGNAVKSGSFEIDLSQLVVLDITDKGMNDKLTGHLKSDDFFGVEKHPKATFVIGSVTPKSGNEFTVKGKLTIKGITEDLEFPATIVNDGKQLTATAKIVVDRTKYDIRYGSKKFFDNIGDKAIYDEFELDLKLVAQAQ